jgi:hypothetical protein
MKPSRWRTKVQGGRNDVPRLAIGLDRQSPERSPNDYLGDCRVAINGINTVDSAG